MNIRRLMFGIPQTLFIVIAVWGLFGFGYSSLFDIVQHKWSFFSRGAAALLSTIVGLLGAVSFLPVKKMSPQPAQKRK